MCTVNRVLANHKHLSIYIYIFFILEGVAPLVVDPSQCNYTTQSGKIAITLEQMMRY